LAEGINVADFKTKGQSGIRAQLFDLKGNKLEMDFIVERDENSTHILNAVSPAWTCALSFAKYIYSNLMHNKN
jgi:L-2-hydroxyglutarate oxidase